MKRIFIGVIILIAFFSTTVIAATQYCIGYIDDWEVSRFGVLYIDGDWNGAVDAQGLCNLDGSWDGVTAEACKAWMLAIQDAAKNHIKVKLKYKDAESCLSSDIGTFSNSKTPEYIKVYGTTDY